MFRKVLYPIDFSKQSEAILKGLPALKKYGVEEVVLFNVIEHDVAALIESGVDVDSLIGKKRKEAEEKMSRSATNLKGELEVKTLSPIAAMDPVKEVVKTAKEEKVSLILLPSTTRGITGSLMGSVSEGIVREADKPVLLLKAKHDAGEGYYEMMFRRIFDRIIFPYDFNTSPQILNDVKDAAAIGGKEVNLVHILAVDEVIEKDISKEEISHPMVPIPNLTEIISKYWKEAQDGLNKVKNELENSGLKVKIILRVGSPQKEMRRIEREEGGTVTIISTKKVITPIMDSIIRYSEMPVIIYRHS